jgi:alkanesulfonate monooxygenase
VLIFTGNSSADPWVNAQLVIEQTEKLVPLVAVQPAHMHPHTGAKVISSLAFVYGRQVDLNLVTGGNRNHLRAVGSHLDHGTSSRPGVARLLLPIGCGKRPP